MAPTGRGGRKNIHRRNQNKPTSSSNHTTTKTLPPNLIIQILTHTDPKSLSRFKCVSKSWYALITHPIFIKKHLNFNTLDINTHVICNAYHTSSRDGSHSRNRNKVVSLLRIDKMTVRLFDIDTGSNCSVNFPSKVNFEDFSKKMVLAGSVNGIVLVMNLGELNERFVGLWNPAISQWKVIKVDRKSGLFGDDLTCSAYGLGYDKANDDIKIIRIVTALVSRIEFFAKCKRARVEIYSVNRGCWEDVESELVFWPFQCNCKFIVKGVPYFVGDDEMPNDPDSYQISILARFDPCTGLFKKVHYPEHFRGIDTWVKLFEFQNSVAVMVQSTPGFVEKQMLDMYVLDDDNTSWIKMYSISFAPSPYLEFHQPQQSFKNGLIVLKDLLQNTPGSYLYDPKTSCVTHLIGIDNLIPHWVESYSHSESLVTIEGMKLIRKDKNKKTKPKKMNRTELLSKDFESALHL